MSARGALDDVTRTLRARGLEAVELYVKRGRSRRFELGPQGRITLDSLESGWAVRATGARASLFAAGSGEPSADGPWPHPDGRPLALPEPTAVAPFTPPPDLEAPLIAEGEAVALLEGIERQLVREAPGARLELAQLVDGASDSELASSRGIEAAVRWRGALLRLEAVLPGDQPAVARGLWAERQARSFRPGALARRVADLLMVLRDPAPVERDRGEIVLAAPLASAIVAELTPLLVGPDAVARARRLRDRGGRIGGRALSVVDDGRLPGGLAAAAVDGEGVPTRRVALVEAGRFRQPLVAWWQAAAGQRSSGCTRRSGWRDVPAPGPTHLYVEPDPGVAPAALLAGVSRGYFLLQETGRGHFDFERDRFRIPVCGFGMRQGRASRAVGRAWLCGGIGALLQGIQGVARDLVFRPLGGLVGSPSLLVGGLEIRPSGEVGPVARRADAADGA